jgi:hypothetical protein
MRTDGAGAGGGGEKGSSWAEGANSGQLGQAGSGCVGPLRFKSTQNNRVSRSEWNTTGQPVAPPAAPPQRHAAARKSGHRGCCCMRRAGRRGGGPHWGRRGAALRGVKGEWRNGSTAGAPMDPSAITTKGPQPPQGQRHPGGTPQQAAHTHCQKGFWGSMATQGDARGCEATTRAGACQAEKNNNKCLWQGGREKGLASQGALTPALHLPPPPTHPTTTHLWWRECERRGVRLLWTVPLPV